MQVSCKNFSQICCGDTRVAALRIVDARSNSQWVATRGLRTCSNKRQQTWCAGAVPGVALAAAYRLDEEAKAEFGLISIISG